MCDNCDTVVCDNVVCERVVCDKLYVKRVVCERTGCERVVCDKVVCYKVVCVCDNLVWKELCVTMSDERRGREEEAERSAQQKTKNTTQRCGEQIQS